MKHHLQAESKSQIEKPQKSNLNPIDKHTRNGKKKGEENLINFNSVESNK